MRKLTTPEKIQEQILKTFQEKKEHFKGKIPQKLKDIPKKFLQPSYMKNIRDLKTGGWKKERVENIHWTKARTKISNSKRRTKSIGVTTHTATPAQAFKKETMLTPHEERVEHNNTKLSITLPSSMSATELIDLIAIIRKSGAKCSL